MMVGARSHLHWQQVPGCRAPTKESSDSSGWIGSNSDVECRAPTEDGKDSRLERFQKPVQGSIPTITRSYKSAVSREFHKLYPNQPLWQRGYYEHVIRSDKEWGMIHDYIESNPVNWDRDQIGTREWMQRIAE